MRISLNCAASHDLESVISETWIRVTRSLETVRPGSVDEFFGLVIVKVRQVLLDMARREGRLERRRHDGCLAGDGGDTGMVAEPGDSTCEPGRLALLTEFHEQVEGLAADERRVFEPPLLWRAHAGGDCPDHGLAPPQDQPALVLGDATACRLGGCVSLAATRSVQLG